MDWDSINNTLSHRVLESGTLGNLLLSLGYDLGYKEGQRKFRTACPLHGDEGDKQFVLRLEGDTLPIRWACFVCSSEKKFVPTLLGLVRALLTKKKGKSASMKEAIDYLKDFLGKQVRRPTKGAEPKTTKPDFQPLARERVRDRLLLPARYFVQRGFDPNVLNALDVGYSERLKATVVPVYSSDGQTCVGYLERTHYPECPRCGFHHPGVECLSTKAKWAVAKGFRKGQFLYDHHHALQSDAEVVFVVEGAPSVFRLVELGHAAVALMGCGITRTQVAKLAAMKKRVVLVLDNDEAGRLAAPEIERQLLQAGVEVVVEFTSDKYKDVGDMPVDAAREWAQGVIEDQELLELAYDGV